MTSKQKLEKSLIGLSSKGRTIAQIARELKTSHSEVEKLLMGKLSLPPGAQMVNWKDNLGRKLFEILPPEKPRASVEPHAFRLMKQPDGEAYIRVFIPDNVKDVNGKKAKFIELWPFSDVHWGHKRCDKQNFIRDIKEVRKRPNRFAFLNGDNMENSLGDSAGGAAWAEQSSNPKEQRIQLEEVFRPIAHKILFAHPGNHEARSIKKALCDPLEEVAHSLDICYFPGPVNMEVVWRGYRWTFYIFHGTGASNTPGGKLNAVGRPRSYNDFRNFFIMGHVHDEMTHKVIRAIRRREFDADGNLSRFWVEYLKEYKVICPAYLLYSGTYAEEAGYSPGSRNALTFQLFANGDYHVISSKRSDKGKVDEHII